MNSLGRLKILAGLAAFFIPFVVYLMTLSPTVNFWDCGEFITTSYTLGIPHPPATPMYVLVGRLAGLLPLFGLGVAHKINILSALFGSLATLMMFALVLKVTRFWAGSDELPEWTRVLGALTASLFIAFSDTFWINAIEAEVYALSAFFVGFLLWLMLDWAEQADRPRGKALALLIFYLLSLGVGFHLGTILILPGFFILALTVREKSFSDLDLILVTLAIGFFLGSAIMHWPDRWMLVGFMLVLMASIYQAIRGHWFALASLGLFLLGISVHIFLMIRAGQNPAINEADPSTWASLWAVIKREQYPFQSIVQRKADLLWQFEHFWNYFWSQFRVPPNLDLPLGGWSFRASPLTALPVGLGLLGIWHQMRLGWRRGLSLIVILLVNTVGLVLFLNFSDSEVRERDYFYAPGFYFFALYIGLGAVAFINSFADRKGRARLGSALAAGVMLIASLSPMLSHWHTHDRHKNYIARDYAINMLAPLKPNAVIFTNGDNDTFPLWYIQGVEGFRTDVRVVNLSLLNTDWYMRQLRDDEPKLPLNLTDKEVDDFASRWYQREDGSIVQPRDFAMDHLFTQTRTSEAGWDSLPYYFAVTVPRETLEPFKDYLIMEGMVYRMTLQRGEEQLDLDRLEENLEKTFIWRGLYSDQPDAQFYKDQTIQHLIQNYALAWSRLAMARDTGMGGREPDPQGALEAMINAQRIKPDVPTVVLYLGRLYIRAGQPEKGMEVYEKYIKQEPDNWRLQVFYSQACEETKSYDKMATSLGRLIDLKPDYEPAYIGLFELLTTYFPSEGNLRILQKSLAAYLQIDPQNERIRERLDWLNARFDSPGGGGAR